MTDGAEAQLRKAGGGRKIVLQKSKKRAFAQFPDFTLKYGMKFSKVDLSDFVSEKKSVKKNSSQRNVCFILLPCGFLGLIACVLGFFLWSSAFFNPQNVKPLSETQASVLNSLLDTAYPLNRGQSLKPLPYPIVAADLPVSSGAAILVDASNGCVLFEKNADEIIPPASITKLFVMYIVFKEIENGNLSLDDFVAPPENSWTVNMPSDASLMFLGQGHQVTVRELLSGLAVASGNDAALALAYKISGSTKDFVARMNYEAQALGLKHTRFEEPSGYSEKNLTTARELAEFCRIYINRYPESLADYHSAREIRYPLEKNLPSWQKSRGDSMAVYQKNTNPLLGKLEGCDGLKTGFIYESGYNLALTAVRDGTRFLSVTMKGPGTGSAQGNFYRVKDGTLLMEWAFDSFADFHPEKTINRQYPVAVPGSKSKFVNLVPAWLNTLTVPHISASTASEDALSVKAEVQVPKFIYGGTKAGSVYGCVQYKLGDTVLETVPLVADRSAEKANLWGQFWGKLVCFRLRKHHR